MNAIKTAVLAGGLFGASGATIHAVLTAPLPAMAAAEAEVRAPKAIWDKLCASCHGADGRGNAAKAKVLKIDATLLDLARPGAETITWEEKKTILLTGKEKMPGYEKKLKAEEIDPLLELCDELATAGRAAH